MPPPEPFKNFNFRVEIDGISIAGFSECSGLGSRVDVIEYREGGSAALRKLPGLRKFNDIVLKRGVTSARELQDWHSNILKGQPDRRNGSVILLDDAGQEVVRWNFFNAFPSRWEGPHLKGDGQDVAVETLTLSCEGLERAS
ncbi:MAG: phage tail protein [Acidobacteriota bacterium]